MSEKFVKKKSLDDKKFYKCYDGYIKRIIMSNLFFRKWKVVFYLEWYKVYGNRSKRNTETNSTLWSNLKYL